MPPRLARPVRPRSPPPLIDHRCLPRPAEPEIDPAMPPVVHPGDEALHPFLQFTRDDDRTDRDKLLRLARLHGYESLRHIAWGTLGLVQLRGRAEALCGPHWRRLFSISEPVCEELAIEFFSTIHLITPLTDYEREDALTFRLGGAERRLSLRQFAVLMGLYTDEELDTPAFTEGITDWPEGVTSYQFWREIGTGDYSTASIPKSTRLRDPLHRIIHRAIVHSITARGESSGSVTQIDLFYLYCMITHRPCQIAERLARFMFSIRHSRSTQVIYGGGYVTLLAKAMAILPEDELEALTLTAAAIPIDMGMLVRMRMARREGGHFILLDGTGRPWVQPRDEDEGQLADIHVDIDTGDMGGADIAGPSMRGDMGAGPSGTAQEPPQTQIPSFVAPDPHTSHQSPIRETHQSPPRQTETTTVYHRIHTGARLDRIETEISGLRATVSSLSEIQRLEFAYAHAHRDYTTRMLQRIADPFSAGPLPQPPVPPQRLLDYYAQVGTSETSQTHQQPPP